MYTGFNSKKDQRKGPSFLINSMSVERSNICINKQKEWQPEICMKTNSVQHSLLDNLHSAKKWQVTHFCACCFVLSFCFGFGYNFSNNGIEFVVGLNVKLYRNILQKPEASWKAVW